MQKVEIPAKVTIELSGDQAVNVLLSISGFTKQGLELGLISAEDWEEREKIIKIFIDATNSPIKCPKVFVKHLDKIAESLIENKKG